MRTVLTTTYSTTWQKEYEMSLAAGGVGVAFGGCAGSVHEGKTRRGGIGMAILF